jgi:exonuclease III
MLGGSSSSSALCPQQLTLELSEELGLTLEQLAALDAEGRALITDHDVFLLVNLYGPALASEERREERLEYKLNFYNVRVGCRMCACAGGGGGG